MTTASTSALLESTENLSMKVTAAPERIHEFGKTHRSGVKFTPLDNTLRVTTYDILEIKVMHPNDGYEGTLDDAEFIIVCIPEGGKKENPETHKVDRKTHADICTIWMSIIQMRNEKKDAKNSRRAHH